MTLKTVTWRTNQHPSLRIWISVSNHNGREGFLRKLQPANSSASPLRCCHSPSTQSPLRQKNVSFPLTPSLYLSLQRNLSGTSTITSWAKGKIFILWEIWWQVGKRDISEPWEAGFLCSKGLVVTHPCRVSCYFHFFPSWQLINIFTPVLIPFMVFLDAFLNWEVISPESRVMKGFLS